jgi:predicted GIY-YIG superfamily endonuclease
MLRDKLMARLAQTGAAPDYSRLVSEVLGIQRVPEDLARRLIAQALVVGDRRENWRRAGERACSSAPSSPGVYVFRDADGGALYVGKAVNLRRRLRAHFADQRWRVLHPAMARVTHVEWREVGSEIEALMREATLIRELRPVVNVQTAAPALRTRAVPRALVRDVVVLLPSVDRESAELVAARADGGSMLERTRRSGADLGAQTKGLWAFFRLSNDTPGPPDGSLGPLVFSWLAGRGGHATRLDPHDASSMAELQTRLTTLLKDKDLFSGRLVAL